MSESTQQKLKRIRAPRVRLTMDVETGGAMEKRELPFVVGVMGDFSGNSTEPLKPLKDRKFTKIDRDNFDEVMAKMTPGLNLRVKNTLAGDDSELPVSLKFGKLSDFDPAAVASQVEPLKKLLDTRDKLRDLQSKADVSDELEGLLDDVLKNSDQPKK